MPSLSPGLHYVHEIFPGGRTLGTIRTYVPGGVTAEPLQTRVFADTAAYATATATRAAWDAYATAPTANGSVIGFLGGTIEWGARSYTLDTGPMFDTSDIFHPTLEYVPPVAPATTGTFRPTGIDLNRISNLLESGEYILAAVPAYGEPKNRTEADAFGLDYYISVNPMGEFLLAEFLPAELEAAVAAAGGSAGLDALIATDEANALQRRAWYLTDPERRPLIDMCIRGVRFILAKVSDVYGCCDTGVSISESELRQLVASMDVPAASLEPIGHAGVLPAPSTVDGVNSDIGIYTYATFFAGAPDPLDPATVLGTDALANNSFSTNRLGPDFGTGNGPGTRLYWIKTMTFYENLQDALMRRNGRTLNAPKDYNDVADFIALLTQVPSPNTCDPCEGLGWTDTPYITATYYDVNFYCNTNQANLGTHPKTGPYITAELSPTPGIDIPWLGRVNPIYRGDAVTPMRAPWRGGGSALHMYADPKPLLRFAVSVTPASGATPAAIDIDVTSIQELWRTIP